jgi:hypothetical protein
MAKVALMASEAERLCSLDLLHTLCEQMDKGRGDFAELICVGFTEHAARELANLIDVAHGRKELRHYD